MATVDGDARGGPTPALDIAIAPVADGLSVVRVAGELDLMTAPLLRDALFDPARCPGPDVRIDLRRVTFIDSVSIGTLVAARRLVTSRGGSISLWCVPGVVTRVLAITKLDAVFAVDVEDAGTTQDSAALAD